MAGLSQNWWGGEGGCGLCLILNYDFDCETGLLNICHWPAERSV